MSLVSASHFVLSGAGLEATVDTAGVAGDPVVSLAVDGREVPSPAVRVTRDAVVVRGITEEVPDDHEVEVVVVVPGVNLDDASGVVTCAAFAVLVTRRTSVGGPGLVSGPLQEYELRPLAATASFVASLGSR